MSSLNLKLSTSARTASRSTTTAARSPSFTSQGYIDWFLKSPLQDGSLLTSIKKETHLSYTLGFKILLITPTPGTELKKHHS